VCSAEAISLNKLEFRNPVRLQGYDTAQLPDYDTELALQA
jgi:hypothetical protein